MASSDPAPRNRSNDPEAQASARVRRAASPAAPGALTLPTQTALPPHPPGQDDAPSTDPTPALVRPVDPIDPDERRGRIEFQAYMLYLQRGGAPGADLDDWLQAERQVNGHSN